MADERQEAFAFDRMTLRQQYDDGTYLEGFWDNLDDHWALYLAFVDMARKMKRRGFSFYSARMILYVLRHHTNVREGPGHELKINDHWSSGFSRLSQAMHQDLRGFFEKRTPPARDKAIRIDGTPYRQPPEET